MSAIDEARYRIACACSDGHPKRGAALAAVFNDFLGTPHSICYSGMAVAVVSIGFVPYLLNQLRKYSCVLRKFDGVLDVP